jgi:hypothetical protein
VRKLSSKYVSNHVILVDNASNDGLTAEIRKIYPEVELIANSDNLGFCEGNNVGIRRALNNQADYVFILNNDTLLDVSCMDTLVESCEKFGYDICSPKIFFEKGFEFHKDKYSSEELGKIIWYAGGIIDWDNILPSHKGVNEVDDGQFDETTETEFSTGCAMLVKRKVFEKVGFLDPAYFAYFEDLDFCFRARKAGFKVAYVGSAKIWHKNASSFRGSGSAFQDFFVTRNRIIFTLRYARLRTKFAVLKEALKYLVSGPKEKQKAIINLLKSENISSKTISKLLNSKI